MGGEASRAGAAGGVGAPPPLPPPRKRSSSGSGSECAKYVFSFVVQCALPVAVSATVFSDVS